MAKQYGLIVPNKDKKGAFVRPSIFDEDSDSEGASEKPTGLRKKPKKQDKINESRALEEDPTVFQYDEVYDEIDKKRKESKLSRKDLDRKPKYISRLLAAADRRKRENELRIERQVQREREAEGEEFKDKEEFVTGAYKKKLEEMKQLEEEEKREEYLESIGDVRKQGNLDGFYRHLYDQKVNFKEDSPEEITIKTEPEPPQESSNEPPSKKKRKYRNHKDSDHSDNEPEVKKEHLPSNLDADSDFSIDSSDSEDEKKPKIEPKPIVPTVDAIKTEIPTVEEPKPEITPEPIKPKINIWKKRTIGTILDEAIQRYFERKSLREL